MSEFSVYVVTCNELVSEQIPPFTIARRSVIERQEGKFLYARANTSESAVVSQCRNAVVHISPRRICIPSLLVSAKEFVTPSKPVSSQLLSLTPAI
jgi:hypothetical protein